MCKGALLKHSYCICEDTTRRMTQFTDKPMGSSGSTRQKMGQDNLTVNVWLVHEAGADGSHVLGSGQGCKQEDSVGNHCNSGTEIRSKNHLKTQNGFILF